MKTINPAVPATILKITAAKILYTVYRSSLPNHSIIMKDGKVLHVINHEFITSNIDEIRFLDNEINAGFPFLTKIGAIESAARDPLKELKDKIIAEHEANKAAEAKLNAPVIGDSDTGKTVFNKLNPASTAILAGLSVGSSSSSN